MVRKEKSESSYLKPNAANYMLMESCMDQQSPQWVALMNNEALRFRVCRLAMRKSMKFASHWELITNN